MSSELLVDFKEFWPRLRADIESARQSVLVQTFAFEGDSVGQNLAKALLDAPADGKRILADSFTRVVLSDRFRYWPSNLIDRELKREARDTTAMMSRLKAAGVAIKFTNPYGLAPRRRWVEIIKKLIVIGETLPTSVVLTSANTMRLARHDVPYRRS